MGSRPKFQINALVLIFSIVVITAVLTWVVPGGEYERTQKNNRTVVVAGSFENAPSNPQGIGKVLMSPVKGFEQSAEVIVFILIIGGVFAVIQKTGAITAFLQRTGHLFTRRPGLKKFFIPVMMFLFSLGGATFGMCEEILAFIPIFVPLALTLGYDTIVGMSIPFLGAAAGFAAAFANPFTIGVAQGIAELPMYSGKEYRLLIWVIVTSVLTAYVTNYARKLKKNPQLSPTYEEDKIKKHNLHLDTSKDDKFTLNHKLILVLFVASVLLIIFGATKKGWYIQEIAGLFFGLGILSGIVGRMKINDFTNSFIAGTKDMVSVALIVAFARAILVVASEGNILDTMLYGASRIISGAHPIIAGQAMLIVQTFINFFIPSGSGQAALTMPIMTPLADVLNVSRQTAVLAFQFGDGFNVILPTSGATMGVLGLAGVAYPKWLKWVWPLMVIWFLLCVVLLIPPYFLNWR
jgi:uncharacterized ion transporter superfamily protein YfcC